MTRVIDEIGVLLSYWRWWAWMIFTAIFVLCRLFRNLAYYRHVQAPRLADIGFDLIDEMPQSQKGLSELMQFGMHGVVFTITFGSTIFQAGPHREGVYGSKILLDYCVTSMMGHFLRFLTYITTSVPGPADHCQPGYADYDPPQWNFYEIVIKGNLSKNHCGDLVFSGHIFAACLMLCAYWRDAHTLTPGRCSRFGVKMLMLAMLAAQAVLIIQSRNHYTMDVVIAGYTAPLIWHYFDGWEIWLAGRPERNIRIPKTAYSDESFTISDEKRKRFGRSDEVSDLMKLPEHAALTHQMI